MDADIVFSSIVWILDLTYWIYMAPSSNGHKELISNFEFRIANFEIKESESRIINQEANPSFRLAPDTFQVPLTAYCSTLTRLY